MAVRFIVYLKTNRLPDFSLRDAGLGTCKRPLAEIVKSLKLKHNTSIGTVAYEALVQLQNIYHTENSLKKLPPSRRKAQRKALARSLVDNYFKWARKSLLRVPPSSAIADGIKYSFNQEKYLGSFLTAQEATLNNNLAEQVIRPCCVRMKNWS
ncbi:IS66 family transposase [Anaerovorax odorimutans]|uniref:IS66 family transposase n=2 Tax=Anaerovorax odorimutans TaxID=109327 RepID=A0ABT1RJC8_9FIRM|nr:IS66 family transposase [Anaerovorax odorimutans]